MIIDHQKKFLEYLQGKLNKGEILANSLMELLNISKDSAYRRLRSETSLSFDELIILANHFNVSLDNFLKLKNSHNDAIFHHMLFDNNINEYIEWLITEFTAPNFYQDFDMIYAAKGLPIYYNLLYPEIALFKAFFYHKVLWKNKALKTVKFDFDEILKQFVKNKAELNRIRNKIIIPYLKTPSIEIWNNHTFDGHLNQLRFAILTGLFKDKKNEDLIINKTLELLELTKLQAETGQKINMDQPNETYAEFKIYFSETVNLDHTYWKNIDGVKGTYTIQNIGDFIYTFNTDFCNRSELYLRNLIEKSTLISSTGDKVRYKLFRKIENDIKALSDII